MKKRHVAIILFMCRTKKLKLIDEHLKELEDEGVLVNWMADSFSTEED
jgi:hypothetical protein